MASSECRHRRPATPPHGMQSQGGDLRKGGASDARYAIVVDKPEARGNAAVAIAVASDVFREEKDCSKQRSKNRIR